MAFETITIERRGAREGVVWLMLNRPAKLNALSMPMFGELEEAFRTLRGDRDARVLVITGAGRAFCAGADFSGSANAQREAPSAPPPVDAEGARLRFRGQSAAFVALKRLEIPTIAAVNGVCVGAGFDLVAHCDMAVVSTAARFQVAYVKRGLFADLGGFWSLPRVIGSRRAMEMMMTGRFMSAEEAHAAGLSNYLVEPADLESKAMELALACEAGPPIAQKIGKMLAAKTAHLDFESALELSGVALQVIGTSQDRAEGVRAFVEKREPRFEGR